MAEKPAPLTKSLLDDVAPGQVWERWESPLVCWFYQKKKPFQLPAAKMR